ncbi:MAG: hypothetical protein ACI9VR_002360 [Cognaticolwellia sp.]|jgi:hypothetical protein
MQGLGQPVISVDTKKKELIGLQEWTLGRRQRSATPQGVRTKECARLSRTNNAAEACERMPRMW